MRILILLLLAAAIAFLATPFVMTSRALDEHGITMPASVYHKSETVKVLYSGWELAREATIEYSLPETGGVSFFDVRLDPREYDALRAHQAVQVRYLLHRDVPTLPMTGFLWQIHALPTVRLLDVRQASRLAPLFTPGAVRVWEFLGALAVLLILWRITRSSALGWAAAAGVVAALGFILIQGFPRPTPAPSAEVRRASGRVKSVGNIDNLFSGSRSRGVIADQPVDVVGVEFVPEGRSEPVLAVDLIDRGSVSGLKEQSTVTIDYEAATPRTAYITGATRRFPQRNLNGALLQGALYVAVLAALLGAVHWIGKAFNRLVRR